MLTAYVHEDVLLLLLLLLLRCVAPKGSSMSPSKQLQTRSCCPPKPCQLGIAAVKVRHPSSWRIAKQGPLGVLGRCLCAMQAAQWTNSRLARTCQTTLMKMTDAQYCEQLSGLAAAVSGCSCSLV
jgi:hypothetical protein